MSSAETTATVAETTVAMTETSAAEAGASPRGKASFLSAVTVAAEGSGSYAALPSGFRVSSCTPGVSGTVEAFAARATSPIETAPVVKGGAAGVVPVVIISCVSAMPIGSPMTPAPSETPEPTDLETDSPGKVRPVIPDAGIRIPPRPRHDGISVNYPRIVCGDVDDLGGGRLNDDRRALRLYSLLRRAFKIAGLLGPAAHHLYGVHDIRLLIVVSVA